jgi:hypothetical protein
MSVPLKIAFARLSLFSAAQSIFALIGSTWLKRILRAASRITSVFILVLGNRLCVCEVHGGAVAFVVARIVACEVLHFQFLFHINYDYERLYLTIVPLQSFLSLWKTLARTKPSECQCHTLELRLSRL